MYNSRMQKDKVMKTILQHQGKMALPKSATELEIIKHGLEEELALDDTAFDVSGWVSIEVGGISVAEVHITDLYPAVLAYKERYRQDLERDK